MNVLVSPLEALAFDYFSFGIFTVVSNLWTWIALVTAALSFWRIRTSGTISISVQSETISPSTSSASNCINQPQPVREISLPEPANQPQQVPPTKPRPSVLEDDSVTKGKFVAYYEDDGENGSECDGDLTVVGEWGYRNGCEEMAESFERLLRMRMGDLGWYRYQDFTVINGNVVKLWDGVRRGEERSACVGVW